MTSIDAIVNRQLLKWELQRKQADEEKQDRPPPPQIVTVSRQLGSRGSHFARKLAEKLGFQSLHREVIDAICRSSGYRKRLIEALDQKFRGNLDVTVESLFTGELVDHGDYYRHLVATVLSLSRLGGVVLLGRGGNIIVGPHRGFHIRFVAPIPERIANLVRFTGVDDNEAAEKIEKSDAERKELIARLFQADNDDARNYDLVINTAFIDVDDLLDTIVGLARSKLDRLAAADTE